MEKMYTDVKPVKVTMQCDCGGTFVRSADGFVLTTYPPQYYHECDKCSQRVPFDRVYPHIEYIPIE